LLKSETRSLLFKTIAPVGLSIFPSPVPVPFEVPFDWPTTTSAAVPVLVGIVFQIRTRLFPVSATISFVALVNIDNGLLSVEADNPPELAAFDVTFGCPIA